MSKYELPTFPYVEARNKGGKQKPTSIILTPSFTTSERGAALGLATRWSSSSDSNNVGHFVIDEATRYRCIDDDRIAGLPGNRTKNAIRIVICAEPVSGSRFWDFQGEHYHVLRNTAELVAGLTLSYKIPVSYFTEGSFARWEKRSWRHRGGIYVAEMNGWPWQEFINLVKLKTTLKTHI